VIKLDMWKTLFTWIRPIYGGVNTGSTEVEKEKKTSWCTHVEWLSVIFMATTQYAVPNAKRAPQSAVGRITGK
jgi:hypothetical protein